jgi:tetratricopeptide (TPR) repeat protein
MFQFLKKINSGFSEKKDFILSKAVKRDTNYGKFGLAAYNEKGEIAITSWSSDEGRQMLIESEYNNAFFSLAHTYQSMRNPFYASIASMVNVLNALRLDRGVIPDNEERSVKLFDRDTGEIREFTYNIYTQNTLLDAETDQVKPRNKIAPLVQDEVAYVDFDEFNPGLSIIEVKQILEIYKCRVELYHARNDYEKGIETFREVLKKNLNEKGKFIIANYYGENVGLQQAGHYSAVAAYHEATDNILILDTAAHKAPWYWIKAGHLYQAMNTIAREGNKRGYLVIEDIL